MECEALYVFWAEIGRRMNMRAYISESREAMIEWSWVCPLLALVSLCGSQSSRQDYEVNNMIPAETNKEVAEYTLAQGEGWDDERIPSDCPTFTCSILPSPPQATCSAMILL